MMPPQLTAWATRIGVTGLVIIVLSLLLVASLINQYADVNLRGPLGIGFHYEGWKPKAQWYKRTIDEFADAQKEALRRAVAAKEKAEQHYRDLAERIDDEAEQNRTSAMDDTERFISTNRVRPGDRCRSSGPAPAAEDNSAGSGEATSGLPFVDGVLVSEADVRFCTMNTLQAIAAREWAIGLSKP